MVASLRESAVGVRLVVDAGVWSPAHARPIEAGDSISVSGVCLTVATPPRKRGRESFSRSAETTPDPFFHLAFDVVRETLTRTTLEALGEGDRVNLESALTPMQPMGGHFVQGHVDGVGEVVEVRDDPADWRVTVRPPASLMRYLTQKGSLCIDGVSLTLAEVEGETATVALIPVTLRETTLGSLRAGSQVNLEADVLAKQAVTYLERFTQPRGEAVTMDLLRRAGFAKLTRRPRSSGGG